MSRDHAGVFVPPPLIYLAFFVAGLGLQRLVPLPRLPVTAGRIVATLLISAWFVLTAWSFSLFRSSRTSILPVRPTTALVLTGPFRFTRNPMYLGMLLIYTGIAFWFGALWPLLLAPGLVWVVTALVIAREERYLDRKFGWIYRQYRARVRRWI